MIDTTPDPILAQPLQVLVCYSFVTPQALFQAYLGVRYHDDQAKLIRLPRLPLSSTKILDGKRKLLAWFLPGPQALRSDFFLNKAAIYSGSMVDSLSPESGSWPSQGAVIWVAACRKAILWVGPSCSTSQKEM